MAGLQSRRKTCVLQPCDQHPWGSGEPALRLLAGSRLLVMNQAQPIERIGKQCVFIVLIPHHFEPNAGKSWGCEIWCVCMSVSVSPHGTISMWHEPL